MQALLDVSHHNPLHSAAALPGWETFKTLQQWAKKQPYHNNHAHAFLDTNCLMPNGSTVPPAQAPSLQERGGPVRLTSRASRVQEQGSRHCVPYKPHPSEDVPEDISSITHRPHMAHAFTVSTGILCPKSTISLRTIVSFFWQMLAVVRIPTTSQGSRRGHMLSQQSPS